MTSMRGALGENGCRAIRAERVRGRVTSMGRCIESETAVLAVTHSQNV